MGFLDILGLISVALILAKILGGIVRQIGFPASVGEIAAGIILGNLPSSLGAVFTNLPNSPVFLTLGTLGVTLTAFTGGLQSDLRDVFRARYRLLWIASLWLVTAGAVFYFLRVFFPSIRSASWWLLLSVFGSASFALITHATRRQGAQVTGVVTLILGAALVGNCLGILGVSAASAMATREGVAVIQKVAIVAAELCFFTLGVYFSRELLFPRVIRGMKFFGTPGALTVVLTSVAVICAWIAVAMNLAAVAGAFAMGLILDNVVFQELSGSKTHPPEYYVGPLLDYLMPVFFVWVGVQVNLLSLLRQPSNLRLTGLYLAILVLMRGTFVLLLSKELVSSTRERFAVLAGILSPGESGLLFLITAAPLGLLDAGQYSAAVTAIVITMVVSAIFLERIGLRGAIR